MSIFSAKIIELKDVFYADPSDETLEAFRLQFIAEHSVEQWLMCAAFFIDCGGAELYEYLVE